MPPKLFHPCPVRDNVTKTDRAGSDLTEAPARRAPLRPQRLHLSAHLQATGCPRWAALLECWLGCASRRCCFWVGLCGVGPPGHLSPTLWAPAARLWFASAPRLSLIRTIARFSSIIICFLCLYKFFSDSRIGLN